MTDTRVAMAMALALFGLRMPAAAASLTPQQVNALPSKPADARVA